mmetsp:Transcript_15252/g.27601  ORF Transcript_15252/g.27601 Transcript_15252/m.27601 type:complete len:274 (-) Transcript_15252:501-1322(-)
MNISIESRDIPVNYSNETGNPAWKGWRNLVNLKETTVTLQHNNGDRFNTQFYWIQMYGWSPGHTAFMDGCSVVIANLGLHYDVHTGFLVNAPRKISFADDMRAVITYLADFEASSSENNRRLAIWRSALPQHFDTKDGDYQQWKTCSLLPTEFSPYNNLYEEQFAEFCDVQQRNQSSSECNAYEHVCTVNRTSMDYPTVYKFFVDNQCCAKRIDPIRNGNGSTVTGTILRWNVADLFNVPLWHVDPRDCSHFCYVPSPYEAAFERLGLLLPLP